jgi:NADH-quinone oxidoreductase subunit M
LVAAFLLITLASVALPGTNGFIGEFLILIGSFTGWFSPSHAQYYTAVAATGVILSAVYMLWMFQRVNYGPLTNPKNKGLRDLSVRELIVIGPVCAMAIFMGVLPGLFLSPMEPAVKKTVASVVRKNTPANTSTAPAAPKAAEAVTGSASNGNTSPPASGAARSANVGTR